MAWSCLHLNVCVWERSLGGHGDGARPKSFAGSTYNYNCDDKSDAGVCGPHVLREVGRCPGGPRCAKILGVTDRVRTSFRHFLGVVEELASIAVRMVCWARKGIPFVYTSRMGSCACGVPLENTDQSPVMLSISAMSLLSQSGKRECTVQRLYILVGAFPFGSIVCTHAPSRLNNSVTSSIVLCMNQFAAC